MEMEWEEQLLGLLQLLSTLYHVELIIYQRIRTKGAIKVNLEFANLADSKLVVESGQVKRSRIVPQYMYRVI